MIPTSTSNTITTTTPTATPTATPTSPAASSELLGTNHCNQVMIAAKGQLGVGVLLGLLLEW